MTRGSLMIPGCVALLSVREKVTEVGVFTATSPKNVLVCPKDLNCLSGVNVTEVEIAFTVPVFTRTTVTEKG
jgi:hypothetical protein